MKMWKLSTTLDIYEMIAAGSKTWDTRAPDFFDREKRYEQAKRGDLALIIPVTNGSFMPFPQKETLYYRVDTVRYFPPQEADKKMRRLEMRWKSIVRRMFHEIPLAEVFPGRTLEKALEAYKQWPSTTRIAHSGLVALKLGKRLCAEDIRNLQSEEQHIY